jgi:hypothetical protein
VFGLAAVVALTLRRRALRRRSVTSQAAVRATVPPGPGDGADDRERLIALAGTLRSALAERFGEGWRAKTTEEIAASPELAGELGVDGASSLVDFLRLADLAKFAGDHFNPSAVSDPASWDGWVTGLVAGLEPEATSVKRSRTNP